MSVIYDYVAMYYKELDSQATDEKQKEGHTLRLFRGSVVSVYRSLAIPQSYYSKVRTSLLNMGCLTILQQGSRGSESVVALHHAPDEDEFRLFNQEARSLTPRLDNAILAQRLDDLTKLIGGVNVVEALAEHEESIRQLKREVETLGKKPPQASRRVK